MDQVLLALRFTLAGLLYLFLGLVLYVMWRSLRQTESEPEAGPVPANLLIEDGQAQERRILLQPITAIGRSRDNNVVIDDPFASSHHALVLWRDGRWWLEDLDSHNGTFLNGDRLTHPVSLSTGSQIRIGETRLVFETLMLPGVTAEGPPDAQP